MKRLNKIARKITAFDEEVEQFIQECEDSGKFNDEQMEQIRLGFESGLTIEEVEVYADPEMESRQMGDIYWYLMNGYTIEEVKEKYGL